MSLICFARFQLVLYLLLHLEHSNFVLADICTISTCLFRFFSFLNLLLHMLHSTLVSDVECIFSICPFSEYEDLSCQLQILHTNFFRRSSFGWTIYLWFDSCTFLTTFSQISQDTVSSFTFWVPVSLTLSLSLENMLSWNSWQNDSLFEVEPLNRIVSPDINSSSAVIWKGYQLRQECQATKIYLLASASSTIPLMKINCLICFKLSMITS